jgi:transposase
MQPSESLERTTIGIDVSDKYSRVCVLDGSGAVVEEGRVATTGPAFRRRFSAAPPARVAIEAGAHSAWISRLLEEAGHEVFVANPRRLRLIYENDKKSDRVDAEWLARVARLDATLLAPIHHRDSESQAALALLRARDVLVRARTQLVNHVRGTVKAFGLRLPRCSTHSFVRQITPSLPATLAPLLAPVLEAIDTVSGQIRAYDRHVAALADSSYPETRRLRQVPGVGPVTALTYVLTLEDPERFPSSRAVGSYLGLRPRQRDSGGDEPQLRITKAGDGAVRRLLVGCAHYILGPFGPDSDLRRWGLRLAERGGKTAKKRAVVAVARKLAVLLHRLWVTGETYEPLRRSATLASEGAPA